MVPKNKVKEIIAKHDTLEKELSSGTIDPKLFAKKSKEYSLLGGIIKVARDYLNFENEREDLQNMLQDKSNDQEIIDLAQKDLDDLIKKKEKYENDLKIFLLPKDDDDDKNAIVEIRAGTGGLEASLFCGLFKMYEKFAQKVEIRDYKYSKSCGFKEVIFSVS